MKNRLLHLTQAILFFDLVYDGRVLADSDALRYRFKVIARNIFLFHIHRHLVTIYPATLRVVGIAQVVCGRQFPGSGFVHQEGNVLGVVVIVLYQDIKGHTAEQILVGFGIESELTHYGKGVLVRMTR